MTTRRALGPGEIALRAATTSEIPKTAATLARVADEAGWTVLITYARGRRRSKGNPDGLLVDSIAVRMHRGSGERLAAVWINGYFAFGGTPMRSMKLGEIRTLAALLP